MSKAVSEPGQCQEGNGAGDVCDGEGLREGEGPSTLVVRDGPPEKSPVSQGLEEEREMAMQRHQRPFTQ